VTSTSTRERAGLLDAAQIPKRDLFGIGVSVTNYREATRAILTAARQRRSFAVTALATHGLMLADEDPGFRGVVNSIDLVTPDGQPLRWALNALHGVGMKERVYGPDLTGFVCAAAAEASVSVYLFGSTPATCERFAAALRRAHPGLVIAGIQPDRFREATPDEDRADVERINASGAGIVLVGRGCPRQERWVAAHRGRIHAAMLAVGAAFDYHAGTLRRPPAWMQRMGLEWLFRLSQEPRRLLGRYVRYNTRFLVRFARELARRRRATGD
jgi:N-acetylglucosaminyldiphosphoundecaprenol N-acetyl-beta-D-mannosaminyltransferase